MWVAVLNISPRTAQKIRNLHGIDPQVLREEVVCRRGLIAAEDDDSERGSRMIVSLRLDDRNVLAVLYPAGDDEWNLGSAYFVDT